MGISRFFNTIKSHYYTKDSVSVVTQPIDIKYFFIDFNAMIHPSKDRVLKKISDKFEKTIVQENITDENELKELNTKLQVNINDLIHDETMNLVKDVVQKCISNLDMLYIAIDGVPSIAKMIEQKKRRFMGKLTQLIELDLVEKYKDDLIHQKTKMNYPNRYLFEKYKIRWSTSHISVGTNFMIQYTDKLNSSDYINKFVYPKKYIFTGHADMGEGEKKIINYIKRNIPNEDVMIYSPDADVLLLAMLLPNKNVYVIRHDDRSDNILIVNINKLRHRFFDLFKLYYKGKQPNNVVDYCRDLILLLTFFGDDFVPRIESYNITNHLSNIINAYAVGFESFGQLTTGNKVNIKCFTKVLQVLTDESKEKYVLVDSYLTGYYRSYGFLQRKFSEWCFKNKVNSTHILFPIIFKKCIKMYYYINKNFDKSGSSFINEIKQMDDQKKLTIQVLYNIFLDYNGDGVQGIIQLLQKQKRLPYLKLPVKRHNLNEEIRFATKGKPFNMLSLKQQQLQKNSKFDIMYFGIEKMIDIRDKINGINWNTYFEHSSTELYQLGYVDIPSNENGYSFNIDKYADKMISKFKKYQFGEKDAIKHYLDGLMWTYYYYNSNDLGMNSWFYDFRKAPLLTDIYEYLEKGYDINKGLKNYQDTTITKNYFTPYQQIVFITPMEDLDIVPSNIIDKYNKSAELQKYYKQNYPDLRQIAKQITDYKQPTPLNCKDELFFNKCTVKGSEDIPTKLQDIVKKIKF